MCAQAQELSEFQALEREARGAALRADPRSQPGTLPPHFSAAPASPAARPRTAAPAAGPRARAGASRTAQAESAAERGLRTAREPASRSSVGGRSGERRVPSPRPVSASRRGALQPRAGARLAVQGSLPSDGPKPLMQGSQAPSAAYPAGPSAAEEAVRLAEERARLAGLRGQLEAALARLDADKVTFERRKVRCL